MFISIFALGVWLMWLGWWKRWRRPGTWEELRRVVCLWVGCNPHFLGDWMEEHREPSAVEIRVFERAARALARLGRSGLHLYLANDTLNLMSGPSHDSDGCTAHPERVRASVSIPRSGGGDW